MNCTLKNRDRIIEDYVTNNLPDYSVESFEIHLFGCKDCFQEVKLVTSISDTIKQDPNILLIGTERSETEDAVSGRREIRNLILGISPRIAAGVAVILVMLVAGYFLFFQPAPSRPYTFDANVPYAYVPQRQTLRSSQSSPDMQNIRLDRLYDNFVFAMLEYKDLNYGRAVEILEQDAQAVKELESWQNEEIGRFRSEFHFYLGLSYLAMARKERNELTADQKAYHLEKAIAYLSEAGQMSESADSDITHKEQFFLGLAYGFGGYFDEAVMALNQIEPDTDYFEDSRYFLRKWSRNRN